MQSFISSITSYHEISTERRLLFETEIHKRSENTVINLYIQKKYLLVVILNNYVHNWYHNCCSLVLEVNFFPS